MKPLLNQIPDEWQLLWIEPRVTSSKPVCEPVFQCNRFLAKTSILSLNPAPISMLYLGSIRRAFTTPRTLSSFFNTLSTWSEEEMTIRK